MRCEKHTTKNFYQHTIAGEILVIERQWNGAILGSCPASEPLKDLDSYECKPDRNIWLVEESDKWLLI